MQREIDTLGDKATSPEQRMSYPGLSNSLVPKKGLEPPHPCEYMDLNHARLPIPPLRHDRSSATGWIGSNI